MNMQICKHVNIQFVVISNWIVGMIICLFANQTQTIILVYIVSLWAITFLFFLNWKRVFCENMAKICFLLKLYTTNDHFCFISFLWIEILIYFGKVLFAFNGKSRIMLFKNSPLYLLSFCLFDFANM